MTYQMPDPDPAPRNIGDLARALLEAEQDLDSIKGDLAQAMKAAHDKEGRTWKQIGEEVGLDPSTCWRYAQQYG
jgi:hypothetical protein